MTRKRGNEIENREGLPHASAVKYWRGTVLLLVLAMLIAGCEGGDNPEPVAPINPSEPVKAQPKLPTLKLWLGPAEIEAELATNWWQQQTGMMFRTNMAENAGMLFVFEGPHRTSFWMKNTIVPLSAAYIDPEGVILEIHDLQPHNTNAVFASSDRIQYVLEVNQGWFKRNHVEVGAAVRTERGSLRSTFFQKR